MEARSKIRICSLILALIMSLNALFFFYCLYVIYDTSRATLYGINVLTALLLFCTLAIQSYVKPGGKRRDTPYLYAVIGMFAASTLIISAAMGFGRASSINDPVIFLSCVSILAVYVYIIVLRDHS